MTKPIFYSVFGKNWSQLPPVMHKHYANRPYCDDVVSTSGKMDITFGWYIKILKPFLKIIGALVLSEGKNIPVTVDFLSESNSNAFCLDRQFYFPNKETYSFYSKFLLIKDNLVLETMRFGIGWQCHFYHDKNTITLKHHRYVWKIFGKLVPFPIDLLFGKIYAEETALSNDDFSMKMTINHPLLGKIYEYRGKFTITKMTL